MPAIKVFVWLLSPMRRVPDSFPAPTLPIWILLLPVETGVSPQSDVVIACALNERLGTVSCVADTSTVATERTIAVGRVLDAGGVV